MTYGIIHGHPSSVFYYHGKGERRLADCRRADGGPFIGWAGLLYMIRHTTHHNTTTDDHSFVRKHERHYHCHSFDHSIDMHVNDSSMEIDIDSGGSSSGGGPNSNAMDESFHDAFEEVLTDASDDVELDCYPYTFTPLLLFAQSDYFDKGYSNFNSVASFFAPITDQMGVNMLENVLFDRKNMLYEDLIDHVIQNEMIVTCCIDAHFTALKIMNIGSKASGVYYDPLNSSLSRYTGDSLQTLLAFLLIKCNYGDSQHIQDNTEHYTGSLSSAIRRTIYRLWKKINLTPNVGYLSLQSVKAHLNIDRYVLVNDNRNPKLMSVQLTSNTCYFQSYLFAVLCKVGQVTTSRDGKSVDVPGVAKLEAATSHMAQHLLEFFTEMDSNGGTVLRPLTNCNFVLDFYRFQSAPYHNVMTSYLRSLGRRVPDYERQYHEVTRYYWTTKLLHKYEKVSQSGAMTATPNSKNLQAVSGAEGALHKLCRSDYYKYRAANFMFGWNSVILQSIESFCEFNSLRKNQLLRFCEVLAPYLSNVVDSFSTKHRSTKYREYYFMGQYEIGQQELVDVHHYTYMLDFVSLSAKEPEWSKNVQKINEFFAEKIYWSTQKRHNYEKMMSSDTFRKSKKAFKTYLETFMSPDFFRDYIGLGFSDINPKEKDINSLTQTVFYTTELMRQQAHRQEFEFEKECINQMARSSIRRYMMKFVDIGLNQGTRVNIKIGMGYCYSKYNTLMHLLNVIDSYWRNPDLSNIQCLGKDIRALMAISCQKIFFHRGHSGFYHYGPLEDASGYRGDADLAVASSAGMAVPIVSRVSRGGLNELVLTDRVFEYHFLKSILEGIFEKAGSESFKSDNEVLNLCLLSLMLDFGLYEQYAELLNLPFLLELQHQGDTKELQVEIANRIYDFDRKNTSDAVTRSRVQELLYETSYKFLVNKDFPVQSPQFKLIRELNSDPDYQSYLLLVKIYMSLCQINRSTEVDYYKVQCNDEFKIIIPKSYSKVTADYLEDVTKRYTFSERDGMMVYDDLGVFDLRPKQPDINLYKIRLDSATSVQSMVKYIEISNVFHVSSEADFDKYLIFIADNVLVVEVAGNETRIKINKNDIEVATIFFNEAISFIPAFKYKDSEDVVLFTSPNIHCLVDSGGQFSSDYYGMRHELIEFIKSEEVLVDLNDEHVFKSFKLSELVTESKTVVYFPDYVLQVPSRQQLINLLDLAIKIRNASFFILVLFYLRRSSIQLTYIETENDATRISGPWKEAILYVLNRGPGNSHYDAIFSKQFFDLNQKRYRDLPLHDFIDVICDNFTRYQRFIGGQYQIVPTDKQKSFLEKIIRSEEPCHFSEVGTGKTKVILPLLCQAFLSNNGEVHKYLSRGGKKKHVLVVLVPEHLVSDARAQVYRYCLNCLDYREDFRVHDDIFALMSKHVQIGSPASGSKPMKRIFVTSFNSFKKVLTNELVCQKVQPHRENFILIVDECDDFLDRNKLVFNICSNRNNAFEKSTLALFYETSRAAYHGSDFPFDLVESSDNPDYWKHLRQKFRAIHEEIQDASRSINKSFGIFNEYTLRHCTSNILHDIEGYKSLIARPYESVNRAMPGSYYSDVERTIYLTYVLLREDATKFDELFQAERKFISFEYWKQHFVHHLDFDDLVYGHAKLSEIVTNRPETKDGLDRYMYEIILRRLEIRDQSRSVSSIDLVFNFDMIGFTGTPFLDNYPTFEYIRQGRTDEIPHLIDRSFYAYSSENIVEDEFQRRFTQFQGKNSHTTCEYVNSDFIREAKSEMSILESLFEREADEMRCNSKVAKFNAVVDLCGVFKRSNIHDVRNLLVKHFGQERFHYIYHIASHDNSDRVLSVSSETDVGYDEEFYNHMCKVYPDGKTLRDKIFFFVDNRNVVGKDIPFQLIFQKHFGEPLIQRSLVIAHDVDDFSKIWQAMGRSRTMNETIFTIYKSGVTEASSLGNGPHNIKLHPLTRALYVRNCDSKMAGNISSIYLTLIALLNMAQKSFFYRDTIVNVFLEKMEKTITASVSKHEEQLVRLVLGNELPAQMLNHILKDKFRLSADRMLVTTELQVESLEELMRHIVRQKFEQRQISGNIYDNMIVFLSGEQKSLMEISYTKQQQKQKTKQQNKNQDSDAMGVFDDKNQLLLYYRTDDYFQDSLKPLEDAGKKILNLPIPVPILALSYAVSGKVYNIKVYPTVQFVYSHHIYGKYVTREVQDIVNGLKDVSSYYANFFHAVDGARTDGEKSTAGDAIGSFSIVLETNMIRQSPQYSMAAIRPGVYVIGMKEQFNRFDILANPLCDSVKYATDEMGFVLFDKTKSKRVDEFGPYFIETYILMEVLSKQEVAQNVMDYFCSNRVLLQRALDRYDEQQGQGFICWRFLINETAKAVALANGRI